MAEITDCTTPDFRSLCGVSVRIDPLQQLTTRRDCILLIDQLGEDASAMANPYTLMQATQATRSMMYGLSSPINRALDKMWSMDPTVEVFVYPVPRDIGTSGIQSVALPDVSTEATGGNYWLWVNGTAYTVSYDPSVDDGTTLAAKFAALIDSEPTLNATAANGVLEVETVATGAINGFLDIRSSYSRFPLRQNVQSPIITVDQVASGAPDLSGLPNITECCTFVSNPYTDDASMRAVNALTCSTWSGDGCEARSYGVFYGDQPNASAFGAAQNTPLATYQAVQGALEDSAINSACWTMLSWMSLNRESEGIAESMVGRLMPDMMLVESFDAWDAQQRAALEDSGMGFFTPEASGMTVGLATTTYRFANNGIADDSYIFANDVAIDAAVRGTIRDALRQAFTQNGYAFRSDGVQGRRCRTKTLTAEGLRNFILNLADRMSECNWIQDMPGFARSLQIIPPDQSASGCIEVQATPQRVRPVCCMDVLLRPTNAPVGPLTVF